MFDIASVPVQWLSLGIFLAGVVSAIFGAFNFSINKRRERAEKERIANITLDCATEQQIKKATFDDAGMANLIARAKQNAGNTWTSPVSEHGIFTRIERSEITDLVFVEGVTADGKAGKWSFKGWEIRQIMREHACAMEDAVWLLVADYEVQLALKKDYLK